MEVAAFAALLMAGIDDPTQRDARLALAGAHPDVREHLDWDQPIGLLLCGILHYILDEENPAGLTATLYRALPPGSYATPTPATIVVSEQMQRADVHRHLRRLDSHHVAAQRCPLEHAQSSPAMWWTSSTSGIDVTRAPSKSSRFSQ